jgi:hypothetical protein
MIYINENKELNALGAVVGYDILKDKCCASIKLSDKPTHSELLSSIHTMMNLEVRAAKFNA